MASLQQESTGTYHVVVFFKGKRFKRSLRTKKESVALVRKDEIEETLDLVKRGRLSVPPGVKTIDFILSGGRLTENPDREVMPSIESENPQSCSGSLPTADGREPLLANLQQLLEQFLRSIPPGSLEDNTLSQMETHRRHLLRVIGGAQSLDTLSALQLQDYINRRAAERTHRIRDKSLPKKCQEKLFVSAATIKKELVTLGSAWRWAESMGFVSKPLPKRGLRWPKTEEKPPFQTWDEIERQIRQDELTGYEADVLWDCLYLRTTELEELLQYVEVNSSYQYFYPFFSMASLAGARRSELIRSRRSDFDFDSNVVTIRELKRVKGKSSTRRVPMCARLQGVMQQWLAQHPGGVWTFSVEDRMGTVSQVTKNQVQNHFKATLNESRWEPIKGWHCLRHSFISNLASAGVDQRIIDDFVGHTTEQMRRRYRHLLPDVKQAALESVFG